MRPDGAVVVADRVVRELVGGHRPDTPARPQRRRRQVPGERSDSLRRGRSRSTAGARCWSRGRRPVASRGRARARTPAGRPSRTRRRRRSARRAASVSSRAASAWSSQASRASSASLALRVEDVALHLGRCDRRDGDRTVAKALRVARVLPRLVLEPATRCGARTRRTRRRRGHRTRRSRRAPAVAGCSSSRARSTDPVQRHTSDSRIRNSGVASIEP